MKQDNVIVVGGGPTGFLTALGLARAGIDVTLLEGEDAIAPSPRAMVYHAAVLDGLERLGILQDAEKIGFYSDTLQLRVFATDERFEFNLAVVADVAAHPSNLHLGQHRVAEIAMQHLQRLPNARVHFGTRVKGVTQDASGVTVHAGTAGGAVEFRGGWVVGADGGRSAVREALGLAMDGMTWPERFVATNVRYDFAKLGYADATMQMHHKYGAIIARIDNEGLWRCTYSEDAALPEEGVLDRMHVFFKEMLPAGEPEPELVQYSPYRMHQRAVSQMRVGRVLLAGDAAHITNPTGGMGLTSGLFDLYTLYPALAAVIQGEAPEAVLDLWASERLATFNEKASPSAVQFKRTVYCEPGGGEATAVGLRHLVNEPALQTQAFGAAKSLETPSVLGRA